MPPPQKAILLRMNPLPRRYGVTPRLQHEAPTRSGPRKARQVQAARRVILLASSSTGVRYSSAEWIRSSL